MAADPITAGPIAANLMAADLITTGPMTTELITTGPIRTDPIKTGEDKDNIYARRAEARPAINPNDPEREERRSEANNNDIINMHNDSADRNHHSCALCFGYVCCYSCAP